MAAAAISVLNPFPPADDTDALEPWELELIEALAAADAARLYARLSSQDPPA